MATAAHQTNGTGTPVRERLCRCSHEEARHASGGGLCLHGCGCEKFRSRGRARSGARVAFPVARDRFARLRRAGAEFVEALIGVLDGRTETMPNLAIPPAKVPLDRAAATSPRAPRAAQAGLGKCDLAILRALVQRSPSPSSRAQVAILSGYSAKSGSFSQALARLSASRLLDRAGDGLLPSKAGVEAAGHIEPLPAGSELVAWWSERVGACAGAILNQLAAEYPRELSREELAEVTGYAPTSGSFSQALAKLRTLEFVTGLRASDALMGGR